MKRLSVPMKKEMLLRIVTESRKTGERSETKFIVKDMDMARDILKKIKGKRTRVISVDVTEMYEVGE